MSDDARRATNKDYIRPMPLTWWLSRKTYVLFMVREATCVFVGGYALFLLVLVMRRDDPGAFAALLESPILIALQIIALPMVVYHSITWLNLTHTVIVLWRGDERVSPGLIVGANYVVWAVVSIVILWIVSLYR